MLRALLLAVLLAANAALAAVQFGWLKWRDLLATSGREPMRVAQQIEPAKIRLLGAQLSEPVADAASPTVDAREGTASLAVAPSSASSASGTSGVAVSAASQAVAAAAPGATSAESTATQASAASSAAAAAVATACLDIGPFSANDAPQARGLLLAALPSGQGDIQSIAVDKRYWVHLDAVPNKAAADKQVAQLRAAGVTEYFLLNDDGSNVVVSLGLFNDRERAVRLMAAAQKKGLTPQLSERPNARSRIIYRIAGINGNAATQVRGVVTQQWSAQMVRACPAPAGSPPTGVR
ncbi:SPOR domain-containing protein [Pandoraea morbifera]|uniref:SPOR domain-containing protein n=1 Tax=Pandoraea morbifera TaxID=2508300 RepID=A0A5E4T502_9BURK|nr:SPOR domain-containing protein [Pandoraea morbifera]VVD82481.1 SPOR domain-containing protein [Pandoraea morbifera]